MSRLTRLFIEAIRNVFRISRLTVARRAWFRLKDLKFFWRFVRPSVHMMLLSLVLSLVVIVVSSSLPMAGKLVIDYVVMQRQPDWFESWLRTHDLADWTGTVRYGLQSAPVVFGAFLCLGLLAGIANTMRSIVSFHIQQRVTRHLRTALYEHVLRFPLSTFHLFSSGYLVSRITHDTNALQHLLAQSIPQVIQQVFRLGIGLSVLWLLSARLTLAVLVALPVYLILNLILPARMRANSRRELEHSARLNESMQDVFAGFTLVKAMNNEHCESRRLGRHMDELTQIRQHSLILQMISQNGVQAAQFISTAAVMLFGVSEIRSGTMSVGDYIAFTAYVGYLIKPVQDLSLLHHSLQPSFSAMDRLLHLFRLTGEMSGQRSASAHEPVSCDIDQISFRHVCFAYRPGQPVIQELSFDARRGSITVLIGPSGIGKTTLLHLLLRFVTPQSGSILLGNTPLNSWSVDKWRENVAWVGQECFLFKDTVEANLRYGNPDASDMAIEMALKHTGLTNEIATLPKGIQTMLAENGANLSGGQKQRVALARALLRPAGVLLLDEPTSALDDATERTVLSNLRTLAANRIILVVSHRPSVLAMADQVIELRHSTTP